MRHFLIIWIINSWPYFNLQSDEILWEVNDQIRAQRLKRFTVPLEKQERNESERKWIKVTEAIASDNQEAATTEKTNLEEEQRKAVADRLESNSPWVPKHFVDVCSNIM